MKLDGYVRVSRVAGREGESYITKDVQRDAITRWAAGSGVEIAEWHTDEDVSGGTLRRPGLDAVMRRVREGRTQGVAVARLDRLSRAGVADALKLVEEIQQHDGKIAALDLGVDPTTAFGEFGLTLMLALARMERRRIKEGWEVAQERAVARGVHVSSITPTGYVKGEDGRLVRHPTFAGAVADLFRMRAAGRSWTDLAEHLNAHGVISAYGTPHWHGGSVQQIVKNRVYLGEARSGEFRNTGAHEPLIDRATWEAAQMVKGVMSPRSDEPALLTGLVRCAACRYRMKSNWQAGRGDKPRLRTYRCARNTSGGTCPEPATVSCHLLDEHVERLFFEAVGTLQAVPHLSSDEVDALAATLAEAERNLVDYRDDDEIREAIGRELHLDGFRVRAARVKAAREELAQATESLTVGELPDRATLEDLWLGVGIVEKNHLLASVIDVVMVRAGRGVPIDARSLVLLAGEAPTDLPGRGVRPEPLRPFLWPVNCP